VSDAPFFLGRRHLSRLGSGCLLLARDEPQVLGTDEAPPALGKVSHHPGPGKQPRPLLLSHFTLPAPGQGCPGGCSPPWRRAQVRASTPCLLLAQLSSAPSVILKCGNYSPHKHLSKTRTARLSCGKGTGRTERIPTAWAEPSSFPGQTPAGLSAATTEWFRCKHEPCSTADGAATAYSPHAVD